MSENQYITSVGMDVHKKTVNAAVVLPGSTKVAEEWEFANEPRAVKKFVKKVKRLAPGEAVACYEAGPCGYALKRKLDDLGLPCVVIAPSLIPVKPGERVKTDRRDAQKLATLFMAGLLTEVHPPDPQQESVRDLTRAREDAKQDQMRARNRLSNMLLRHGFLFTETRNWTKKHRIWLRKLRFESIHAQRVFEQYLLSLEQIEERLATLDEHIEEAARSPEYAEKAGWLGCLRGVGTVTAMTILAELHDFRRFQSAPELMSYLGMTPSEYSSGESSRRGRITKAGNSHVRRLLVVAAKHYLHRPAVSAHLRKRRAGQPKAVIAAADRASSRLHRRYYKLRERSGKHLNVATAAVARELAGFIWAVMRHEEI